MRRSTGVACASPHSVKAASEQARVTLVTGFSILADKSLPFELSTFKVTSNVSLPTEAAKPVSVLRTCTQLLGVSAIGARIQSAGSRIFGTGGGTCLISSVATRDGGSTSVNVMSKSMWSSPSTTTVPSAHEDAIGLEK